MEPWQKLPLTHLRETVEREQFAGHYHRPAYTWFRAFGRRPGSLFRFLLIATLSDSDLGPSDVLRFEESEGWNGRYVEDSPLQNSNALVVDPMMGSGPTILEGARAGVDVVGLEYNPVLWWVLQQTVRDSTSSLDEAFTAFISEARSELDPYVGGTNEETVLAYLLALVVDCPSCRETRELHTEYELSTNEDAPSVYLCPNTECTDRVLERDEAAESDLVCRDCGTTFSSDEGTYERGAFECTCGYHGKLTDYFAEQEQKPSFNRYAVFCRDGDGVSRYRSLEETDRLAIERVERQYREEHFDLPIPTSKIENGETTRALLQHNFTHYRDLFTERQQFVLAKLFDIATRQSPQAVAEQLVTIVASTLHYNNALTTWSSRFDRVESVFRRHTQPLRVETVEANPLAGSWPASLETAYERFADVQSYLESPYETLQTPSGDENRIELPGESLDTERIRRLAVSSADRIDMAPASADCAVVDPPYYDAVQHGELLDFYYVWLREVLAEQYPEFSTTHVPKLREISVNEERGKDRAYYHRALRNSLEEIHRILSTGGDLIFVYHIPDQTVWRDVCTVIVRAGFQIRGAIPLTDPIEDPAQPDSVSTDVVIFARKSPGGEEIAFETVRQNLLYDIQEMIREERNCRPSISDHDLRTILQARGLSEFSRHYPNVRNEDGAVGVQAAIEMVSEVLDKTV